MSSARGSSGGSSHIARSSRAALCRPHRESSSGRMGATRPVLDRYSSALFPRWPGNARQPFIVGRMQVSGGSLVVPERAAQSNTVTENQHPKSTAWIPLKKQAWCPRNSRHPGRGGPLPQEPLVRGSRSAIARCGIFRIPDYREGGAPLIDTVRPLR